MLLLARGNGCIGGGHASMIQSPKSHLRLGTGRIRFLCLLTCRSHSSTGRWQFCFTISCHHEINSMHPHFFSYPKLTQLLTQGNLHCPSLFISALAREAGGLTSKPSGLWSQHLCLPPLPLPPGTCQEALNEPVWTCGEKVPPCQEQLCRSQVPPLSLSTFPDN